MVVAGGLVAVVAAEGFAAVLLPLFLGRGGGASVASSSSLYSIIALSMDVFPAFDDDAFAGCVAAGFDDPGRAAAGLRAPPPRGAVCFLGGGAGVVGSYPP